MKQFYSHIIEIDSLTMELDTMDLSSDEKLHLAKLVDSNLHHTILDLIFDHLSETDKRLFLEHLANNDHDKIWELLNNKADNIEEKIKRAIEELKNELHQDLKEAKKIKNSESKVKEK